MAALIVGLIFAALVGLLLFLINSAN